MPPMTPRQHGGPVSPGKRYVVGEKRPELFVPNTAGRILPSVGGGGSVTVIVQGSVISEGRLVDKVHEALIAKKRRTGSLQLV